MAIGPKGMSDIYNGFFAVAGGFYDSDFTHHGGRPYSGILTFSDDDFSTVIDSKRIEQDNGYPLTIRSMTSKVRS